MDTQCGNRLVLMTDSSVVFVKNVSLNGKRKTCVIIAGMMIIFSDVKSAEAIGTNLPPQQRVVSIMPNRDASRLIQPSKVKINWDIEPKIMMRNLSKNVKNPVELYLPKYKIRWNGNLHDTEELTSRNISEGFVIYEKLTI